MKLSLWFATLICAGVACADPLLPRVEGTFAVDGDLSDPLWAQALRVDRFYDIAPGDNAEPPAATVAWLGYDSRFLYVAFRADDPRPERIRAPYVSRDRIFGDQDFVQVDVDTRDDGKSATLFRVNARGIQADGVYTESSGADDFAPDFDFESAARLTPTGWQVEMRIPLSALRYPRAEPQTWRITLFRLYPRDRRYEIRATPVVRGASCWLCGAQRVGGIRDLPPAGGMTVVPYASSRTIRAPGGVPSRTATDVGGDFKWLPTPGMSFDATLRPDFSQVESDAAQLSVNSRFALFYPEKRPFFMEGADLLSSPIQAIHSRTITSPLWGARLTGRPGNHAYTLVVADDRGGGSVIVPGPASSTLAPQPGHSLSVLGRYRYSHGRSSGGLLLTSRRSAPADYLNVVAGPDVLWWPREADRVRAQVLFSRTTHDGRRGDGHAAVLSWDRNLRRLSTSVTLRDLDRDFRADSGFVPQTGIRSLSARASWTTWPRRVFSRFQPEIYLERVDEQGGGLVSQNVYPRTYAEGWRATAMTLELHPSEKGRAADGSIHDQRYAFGAVRFLLSRRVPYLKIAARHGDELEIERARVGRGTTLMLFASLQPLDRLQLELGGQTHRLAFPEGRLFQAQTQRAMATWTFNSRAFARVIADRQSTEWSPLLAPGRPRRSGALDASFLLAYRLNWQTSLYAGYGDMRAIDRAGDYTAPRKEIFLKLSYALHIH